MKKGETHFQNALEYLSIKNIPNDLIDICDYYRMVRNYMAHTDRDDKKLKSCYKKVEENSNDFLKKFHLNNTPNSLENINFDDFIILTNIIKHIAFIFSTEFKPDNKRIAKILFDMSKETKQNTYKKIKK
ncbi:hypothetical protein QUF50_03670 [Thiotrichales bacterium HSG1]|nr:hypothetical protein [Thiotrichales bacterium HSG1]